MPQTVNLGGLKASWTLSGRDLSPRGRAWAEAPPKARAAYWPLLAKWSKEAMLRQLAEGEGRDGRRMRKAKEISRRWYRERGLEWRGPSMSPQRERSRFSRHLRVAAYPLGNPDRVVGFWTHGSARIAHWHAMGETGRGRPYFGEDGRIAGWQGLKGQTTGIVRDFVGLNPKRLAWAVSRASEEWTRAHPATPAPRKVLPLPEPRRQPAPRPAARAKPIELSPAEKYPFLQQFRPSSPIVPGIRGPAVQPSRVRRVFGAIAKFFRRLGGVFG